MIEQLTIKQTSKALGKTEQFVRKGLQQGVFPWGYAVMMDGEYAYFINKKKFEQTEKGGIAHEKTDYRTDGTAGCDRDLPIDLPAGD